MTWKTQVLVVANVTADSDALLAALQERATRGPATFVLLVPATGRARPLVAVLAAHGGRA